MKAIETKYYGPTDTRGSRIVASDGDGNRVSISYPYELSGEAVHRKAAEALCKKMGWAGAMASGATKRGYAFVFVPAQPWTEEQFLTSGREWLNTMGRFGSKTNARTEAENEARTSK